MSKVGRNKAGTALREVDAPFYRYWQALYYSFYNGRLYIDVGKRWKGLGITYLLLLMTVVTIPLNLRLAYDFNRYYDEQVIEPLNNIPQLFIQNGNVTFDKPMPYLIKNSAGKVVLIIDTTGMVNSIDGRNPDLTMLITRDQFLYKLPSPQFFSETNSVQPSDKVYTEHFPKELNQVFTGNEWIASAGINRVKWGADFLVFPMVIALFFALFLVLFLSCSLMSQLFAKIFVKSVLTYKQSCRLFIVSATPAITVLMLSLAFNYKGAFLGLALLILMIFYYYFAVFALKRESNRLVVS